MKTGIIFDIKEFSIFDGPGIRQTVFLKGCPLRCNWCHNPEGLSPLPQIMVSKNACLHCGKCEASCEHPDGCVVCGKCVEICPANARRIAGTRMTSDELAARILKDAAYYRTYNGGVTFSGGEPLLQADFLVEALQKLPDVHKALMKSGRPHRLRIPLIPGVNDTVENLDAFAGFVSSVNPLTPIELLPYHKTAGAKYEMVGMEYKPIFQTDTKVSTHPEIFEKYGLEATVL